MLNALEKAPQESEGREAVVAEGFGILLRILSPIAPHICHALWIELGYGTDILAAPWPEPLEARWYRTRRNWCCRSMASIAATSA
jgi:leucyl-tRNA synthetase